MWQFCLSAWRCGLRSRSIQAILILGAVLIGVAYLSASFSPRQPRTVALDVGFSGLRISLVLLVLFWVQELVGREIERRTVLFALTYPVSRASYLAGRFLGILGLLALAAVMLGLGLWSVALTAGGTYEQQFGIAPGLPFWMSVLGLWADAAIVGAFALCLASLSTVPILPLALGLAFAIGGKALGAAIDYLARGASGDTSVMRLGPLIDTIQWVLPDLSRLDWRAWPMYGAGPDAATMGWSLAYGLGYAGLMLALAALVFARREFN
jgi:Cu-processing system permease protein